MISARRGAGTRRQHSKALPAAETASSMSRLSEHVKIPTALRAYARVQLFRTVLFLHGSLTVIENGCPWFLQILGFHHGETHPRLIRGYERIAHPASSSTPVWFDRKVQQHGLR